jgi:hypothetical protein
LKIRRVNHGRGHSYVDTETGLKVPGVTSITGAGIPKDALVNWAANTTAEAAVDRWDELGALAPSKRLKELQRARYLDKDAASNRGTQVHKLAQRLVAGERVAIPEGLEGYVTSYVRFLDEFDVQPVLVEAVIVNHENRYCGTLDLIADLLDPDTDFGDYVAHPDDPDPYPYSRCRWLLDIKTSRSGIFGETALQLAGYRFADAWVDEDGNEHEMPEVERTGAVHVRPDGYDLVPVEAGEIQHRTLLYAQQIGEFVASSRDLVGDPIKPAHTSVYHLERT